MSTLNLTSEPKIARKSDVQPIHAFGDIMWPLLEAADTDNQVEVSLYEGEPGGGPPLHVHTVEDEIFFIKEGQFEFTVGGQKYIVNPGDVVFAPRLVPHRFECIGDQIGRMTIIFTPGNFAQFFRDCAEVFATGAPDFGKIIEISGEYGIYYLEADDVAGYMQQNPTVSPKIIRKGSGERLTLPGGAFRFLLEANETDGTKGLVELQTPVNVGPPLHIHNNEDELFIITSGEYEFQLDNQLVTARAGDVIWAPRPFAHAFRATGSGLASMHAFCFPGGFEAYFRRLHQELIERGFSRELLQELHAEYGLENPVR